MTLFKKIILIVFACIFLFGSFCFAQFIYDIGKSELKVTTTQKDVKITINGTVVGQNSVFLKPGNYLISATKNGYYEYRKDIEIKGQPLGISVTLNPEKEKSLYELFYGGSYDLVTSKYPIMKKLPYDNFLISINYSDDSTLNSFKLSVRAYNGYRQAAITKIKKLGYNPAEFNIEFKDYENPFKL